METNKIYNYIEFDYEIKIDNQKSNDTRNSFNKSILFNFLKKLIPSSHTFKMAVSTKK